MNYDPPVPSRRVPIKHFEPGDEHEYAPTHEVLVNIADLLTRQLAEIQHIRNALAQPSDSRSSATVKTSTRGVDLEVHNYADGILPGAVNGAIAEYARGRRELDELQASNWQDTAEMAANGWKPS